MRLADTSSQPGNPWRDPVAILLMIGIAALFALKILLVHRLHLSFDEFNYLSKIYDFQRGGLSGLFQSFHVHLFAWLPATGVQEIDQVIWGRRVGLALTLVELAALLVIGRHLLDTRAALFGVFCALAFGNVLLYGESFRADSPISALFLSAAALLVVQLRSQLAVTAAAVCMALAAAISVKTAIYAPSILGIFLAHAWRQQQRPLVVRRLLLFSIISAGTLAALMFLHARYALALPAGVAATPELLSQQSSGMAQVGGRLFDPGRLFPKAMIWLRSLLSDTLIWGTIVAGFVLLIRDFRHRGREQQARLLTIVALGLPLITLLVYRNAYEYFYGCIIPAACLAGALTTHWIAQRWNHRAARQQWLLAALVLGISWQSWQQAAIRLGNGADVQRQLIAAVKEIFPEPVPYLDKCAMVTSYPAVGPFISALSMETYRARGRHIVPGLLATRQPVFLLANTDSLLLEQDWSLQQASGRRFLQDDFLTLQENFIHHWGPIWVAGKHFPQLTAAGSEFQILIPGPYTVEAGNAVAINSHLIAPGDVVTLSAGVHTIRSLGNQQELSLRYGQNLSVPARQPLNEPLFAPRAGYSPR